MGGSDLRFCLRMPESMFGGTDYGVGRAGLTDGIYTNRSIFGKMWLRLETVVFAR